MTNPTITRWLPLLAALLVGAVGACGTRPNPAFCCVTAEDCQANGLAPDDLRPCAAGLACVDSGCQVATCSTQGCSAEAPVCDITTDVCTGCSDSTECSQFGDTDVCDTASGSCVECVANEDCEGTEPICDGGSCRGCQLDSECASGACGEDGVCLEENAIAYVATNGMDTGECLKDAPCSSIGFAISRTSVIRNHIVMAEGAYEEEGIAIHPFETQAQSIVLHGHGGRLMNSSAELLFTVNLPAVIRDLEIEAVGSAFSAGSSLSLERVSIRAGQPISSDAPLSLKDVRIEGTGSASVGVSLSAGANLVVDRAVISGGSNAITAVNATVQITNLLAYGTALTALDIPTAAGEIAFSTIADSGAMATTEPRLLRCGNLLTVRSSIIWDPMANASQPPASGSCIFISTIAGATSIPGAINNDPQFVDPGSADYHLASNSPARDMVDTGPPADYEGDPPRRHPLRHRSRRGSIGHPGKQASRSELD